MIKTSAITIGTSSRYCAVGTGPGTNKACIPCDIGLGSGHCVDTLTGWKPCPRYGPIPPDCTLNPFRQSPEDQLPTEGGVLQQPTTTPTTPPPLFGRNDLLQGGGFFEQQPAAIVPPTPVLTPEPTPDLPVPMFGSTQQATPTPPPLFGQIAPQGQAPLTAGEAAPLTDREVAEQPIRCPVGNVWDPNLMICVPDLPPPPRLCPDGSIPQSTGPGGTQPECPPFEAEQPEAEEQEEEPQDDGQEEPDEGQDIAGPLT